MTINKINDRKYIGQHTKFNDNYLGSGKILLLAIDKYGKENFKRVILDYAYTQEQLNELEKYYIKYYNAIKSREFYNIHVGGQGGDTYSGKSDEEKEAYKELMRQKSSGENNGMYGKTHNEEAKEKIRNIRLSNSEIYKSAKFREKISEVTQGKNNGMYGKHHTTESKKSMSINSQGKTLGNKNGMFGKKDDKALNGKKIYQYTDKERTNLINIFMTVRCALKYLGVKNHTALDRAIKKGTEYKGFYWSKE